MGDDYMPTLPPDLAKRKREQDTTNDDKRDDVHRSKKPVLGPVRPVQGPAQPVQGPARPVQGPARPVQGPARPPPSSSPSSDEEIGPPLPTNNDVDTRPVFIEPRGPSPPKKLERDEWMLKPPPSVLRVDPTKIKSRQFQRRGPRQQEQEEGAPAPRDKELGAAVEAYNAAHRSKSLMEKHAPKKDKDDPSSRPFDREKDIVGTQRLDPAKSREFIKKAGDLGDRFGRSKYL